jgi:hypothetical protein
MGLVTGDVEDKEPTNLYAWGLVFALVGWFVITAFSIWSGNPVGTGVFIILLVVNGMLATRDMYRNAIALTPLRFVAGACIVPVWLWVRASGAHVGRAPFWVYLVVGVLGSVTLGGLEAASRIVRPVGRASVAVNTRTGTEGVAAVSAATTKADTSIATNSTASSAWSVSSQVDKLTDRETLKAVTRAAVEDNPKLVYELTLRCDQQTRATSLAMFEDQGFGVLAPRMLPFETRVTGDSMGEYKKFSFRHDSGAVQSGMLMGREGPDANTAAWDELTVTFRVESARIASWNTTVANARAGKVAYVDAHTGAGRSTSWADLLLLRPHVLTMPLTRLVVADVFPNETVEFSFSTLTSTERGVIESACFPLLPALTAVPEPPAGSPWDNLPEVPPWDQLDPVSTAPTPEASDPNPAAARTAPTATSHN